MITLNNFLILEIRCAVLPSPPNHGRVYCTNSTNVGSQCTFVCADEFRLAGGTRTRRCIRDGESANWDGKMPKCTSKFFFPI